MKPINGIKCACFVLIISLIGCYEDKIGCLDVDSANYDVTADEECEDCCTFPILSVKLTHRLNGEPFSLGDTVTNNLGHSFILESFHYFISDAVLKKDGQSVLTNLDSISLIDFSGSEVTREDNFALISKSTSSRTLHRFSEAESFDEIQINLGIPETVNHSLELTLSVNHPLALTGDSLYISPEEGYMFARTRIITGEELADTLILSVSGDDNFVQYNNDLDSMVLRGTSFSIPLRVEYACWFDDMDFANGTTASLSSQLKDNIFCGFSIE